MNEVRIDKWLWAVRVFKTRSQATDACKKGKVLVNNIIAKPSRNVAKGDSVGVKKQPVTYTYLVKEVLSKRVSAKLVSDYMEDITPEEELLKLKLMDSSGFFVRERGAGRPTKKERRTMDKIKDDNF